MKNNMIDKIFKQMSSLGKLSKRVITYGSTAAALLFVIAAAIFYYNNLYLNNWLLMYNCIALMKASVSILAEVVIGGLLMDNIMKMYTQ